MWDYAQLSKVAKKFGGPTAFVLAVFTAGRIYERRKDINRAGVKIIDSIITKIKNINNDTQKIEGLKKQLIDGINEYDNKEEKNDKI